VLLFGFEHDLDKTGIRLARLWQFRSAAIDRRYAWRCIMSIPADPQRYPEESGFSSTDCKIIEFDGPADTTVRPCRPELLPGLLAVRELYVQAGLLPPWTRAKGQMEQPDSTSPDEKQS
jgi:hypothetical protein